MVKTTIYLPADLKHAVAQLATESGRSEAEVIRSAIRQLTNSSTRPRPRGGLFNGSDDLSEHVDEALAGFGGEH